MEIDVYGAQPRRHLGELEPHLLEIAGAREGCDLELVVPIRPPVGYMDLFLLSPSAWWTLLFGDAGARIRLKYEEFNRLARHILSQTFMGSDDGIIRASSYQLACTIWTQHNAESAATRLLGPTAVHAWVGRKELYCRGVWPRLVSAFMGWVGLGDCHRDHVHIQQLPEDVEGGSGHSDGKSDENSGNNGSKPVGSDGGAKCDKRTKADW